MGSAKFNRNSKDRRAWRGCLADTASSFVEKFCVGKIVCYKILFQGIAFNILKKGSVGSLGEIKKEPGIFSVIHAKYSKICRPINP